nr:MAG TPA: hypothetical protein [Bacteriophage sp.]
MRIVETNKPKCYTGIRKQRIFCILFGCLRTRHKIRL